MLLLLLLLSRFSCVRLCATHQRKEEAIPGRNSLQVLVRMLCFVSRMIKATDVFHLEVGWRGGVRYNPICILTWILLATGWRFK